MPGKVKKISSWKKVALSASALAIVAGSAVVAKQVIVPGEKVIEVIDGDSFKINSSTAVRLYGADAPEMENCYGQEAKDALTKKVLGKRVVLKEIKTDIYRRVLALVYLDGEPINEYMVKNGYAESHRSAGTQTDAINSAEDFAKQNKIGIFSSKCYQLSPPNPKCIIKGNITQSDGSKQYFVPGCSHYSQTIIEKYRGDNWFCSEKEAKAVGFTKATECP